MILNMQLRAYLDVFLIIFDFFIFLLSQLDFSITIGQKRRLPD